MRHKKKINHLGRQRGHRIAMLSNMATSLIMHKRITTTTAKAKALKIFIEPIITKAKDDTTHSRRHAFTHLQDKDATNELFREVAVKVGERPGGYTRIIKLGKRLGDNADMCIMELVDFNENMLAEKAASKTSRRRRGAKKKAGDVEATAAKSLKEKPEVSLKSELIEKSDDGVAEVVSEAPVAEVEAEVTEAIETVEDVNSESDAVEGKKEEDGSEETAEEVK